MKGILLVGGGGHCRAVIDVLEARGLPIHGVIHGTNCPEVSVLGYRALGSDADLPTLRASCEQALVTLGQINKASIRQRIFTTLDELGFILPTVVSPLAHVSTHAHLGRGTVVMHHALVNTGALVGANCIINTKALIEHDCVLEDHCHVAVGATLCGGVHLGKGCFIGAGATVHQKVHIGRNSLIGMGCVVRHNVPEGCVYVGTASKNIDYC